MKKIDCSAHSKQITYKEQHMGQKPRRGPEKALQGSILPGQSIKEESESEKSSESKTGSLRTCYDGFSVIVFRSIYSQIAATDN